VKRQLNTQSIDAPLGASTTASRLWRAGVLTLLTAFAIALAVPRALAQADPAAPRAKPAFPSVTLPQRAQAEQAIAHLGNRLPDVAAWYGMSVPKFTGMLRADRTAWLDRKGRVFFEEEVRLPAGAAAAPAATDPLSPNLEPLDQTFYLHSRPGAKRTIYLNFVGATLTNTAWNSSGNTIIAEPFDLDGVPYSFSSTELERIQYIWKRVAEDYSAFDVDVTTEPPPADKLTRSSSSDDVFGTTVLITKRTFYSCSCGGVAYLTSFDDVGDFFKPALVFYDALGGGNEKYVADAVSHEAGHNVGLSHDGTASSGYYTGHGSGATGWAPIMGVGYYQQLVQWSKGEYAGANNTEDDYVVMQATGLPIRTDDHGNTLATATPLAASTTNGVTTFSGSGVIERPGDVDVFSFTAGAGSVTINVSPAPRGPKLDILATLRNSAGTVLATSNPVDSLPATLTANTTSAGTYYVTVDGVGKGDPLSDGYTDYGSVGQYAVSGTTQATASQPPTALLAATPTSGTAPLTVNFNAAGSSDSDGTIVSYAWNFGDGGSQTGGTTALRTYSAAGTYTATLTVTDNSGLTDTKTVTIAVQQQATTYALTVSKAGSGTGTVGSTPAGISCGASCTASFASGASVTLTAAPAAGATFAGWSGACSGTGSCTVSMTQARAVTATFNTISYALTVSKGGLGTGTVSSSPAGIDCGASCAANYAYGTTVTLTAAPAAGATFAGWSGVCSGTGTCTVGMTEARALTATFNAATYALTVSKAGTGTGTVSSSPAGINCGATCTANYTAGTSVTLTAAPAAGATFAGWSGACSGTGSCTVSMTAATAVTATFNTVSYALTVSKGGLGTGTVSSTPAGISCGASCTASFASGTSVTLTAAPAAGATFAGWSGACSGTGSCTVSMAAAQAVTATFDVLRTTSVSNIAMSLRTSWGRTDAQASVTVRDNNGNPVSGATVTGTWSGAVSGSASLVTNSSGQADFRSARVSATTGSVFTFTVTGITLSGYLYDSARNVETGDSIAVGGAQRPTAVLSADRTSGPAPLTVNFSATGSSDVDGTIVSYAWNFGDGSQGAGASAAHTYSTAGTYNATLTVTDNAGLADTRSITITPGTLVSGPTLSVANIAMSLRAVWGRTDALASVTVRDNNGNPVSGATVSGTWSGVVGGSASLVTNSSGQADFVSARVNAATGSVFTFTVTGITLSGYAYDPARNVETSDSIIR
jgi:PKD repeat protein